VVPGAGFEPATFGLQNRCTTTVLTRHFNDPVIRGQAVSNGFDALALALSNLSMPGVANRSFGDVAQTSGAACGRRATIDRVQFDRSPVPPAPHGSREGSTSGFRAGIKARRSAAPGGRPIQRCNRWGLVCRGGLGYAAAPGCARSSIG
jgi:hypothetical protein